MRFVFPTSWRKVKSLPFLNLTFSLSLFNAYTIIPTLSKLLARIVHCQAYIITYKDISYWFPIGLSLQPFIEKIFVDHKKITGAVYIFIGLRKGFDTVDQKILVEKLKAIGLPPSVTYWVVLLAFIKLYLSYDNQQLNSMPQS